MVKQFGVNLFAVIICTLVLLTGWGCTKKISTTDNVISEGHTDERGTNEYNLALSERRTRTTKRYLVARGIAPERIRTITYVEERPFCSEQTEECFQLNRRAHFVPSD